MKISHREPRFWILRKGSKQHARKLTVRPARPLGEQAANQEKGNQDPWFPFLPDDAVPYPYQIIFNAN